MEKFDFLFFSTDDLALPTLDELVKIGNCLGIVTTPPRPKGRGRKITANSIDNYAQQHNIKIIYTQNAKDTVFINELTKIKPELIVVFSFPFILPKEVLDIPRWAVNVHPSLLPKYRGASPIRWVLFNGEKTTGITTILMNEQIDAGEIVDQFELQIAAQENYGELREKLSNVAPRITTKTIKSLIDDTFTTRPQDGSIASYAPKINKEFYNIDWNKSGVEIVNLVRGLAPQPGARTNFKDRLVKILACILEGNSLTPGKIRVENKKLIVGTVNQSIEIKRLKIAGSKEMTGQEFINGFHPHDEIFGA